MYKIAETANSSGSNVRSAYFHIYMPNCVCNNKTRELWRKARTSNPKPKTKWIIIKKREKKSYGKKICTIQNIFCVYRRSWIIVIAHNLVNIRVCVNSVSSSKQEFIWDHADNQVSRWTCLYSSLFLYAVVCVSFSCRLLLLRFLPMFGCFVMAGKFLLFRLTYEFISFVDIIYLQYPFWLHTYLMKCFP